MIQNLITNYKEILFDTAIIFSSVFELVLAYVLINSFYFSRFKKRRFDLLPFIALGAAIIFLQNNGMKSIYKYLIELVCLSVLLFTLYGGDIRSKIIGIVVFSLIIGVSEVGSSFIFELFMKRNNSEINSELPYMTLGEHTLSNGIMIIMSVVISIFSKHLNARSATSFRLWIALFSVPVVTLITLSVYQFCIELYPVSNLIILYIYASCAGLIFINILVFVLFSRLQKQLVVKSDTDMLSSQLQLQEASINRLETLYNHTRDFRHDIKNHFLLLSLLAKQGNYDELNRYLQDMNGVMDELDYVKISGISSVDAILNEKLYEAQSKQITTGYDVVNLDKNDIKPLDLCIILSNALDNAMEANLCIEDTTRRYIKLRIHGNGSFCVISVANPTDKEPEKNAFGRFLTSKSDKESHGLGLRSIENTVNKYKGEMLTKYEDGVFTLVIRLNCNSSKKQPEASSEN